MLKADWIIRNVHLATMQDNGQPYGRIEDGLLAVVKEKIIWVGHHRQAPEFSNATVVDGGGGWLTPGLVDCHTHLVFGGNRAEEFEQRLAGKSYEAIAREGGGINGTVAATRSASEKSLLDSAARRLGCLLREGVTTVEVKSGYGLDLETELRMRLGRINATFVDPKLYPLPRNLPNITAMAPKMLI